MTVTLRRILVFLALFLSLGFLVVLAGQTLQLSDFAARFHPVAGEAVFWGLVFAYLLCLGVPIYLFLRLPKALVPPSSQEDPDYERHLKRLRRRLARNPLVTVDPAELETVEGIEAARTTLDERARELIAETGSRAFLTTAISQNGALDSVLMLGLQSKLVWDVAHVYAQRPTLRDMTFLYVNVLGTAFLASELDEAEMAEVVQPVVSAALGSAASAVPGLQVASSIFVNSVLSGSANAFLTLRVGIIAREYSRALVRPKRATLRRAAVAQAAGMLGSIVVSGAGKVSGAIARASGERVSGAIFGMGQKVKEAGGALARRMPFTSGDAEREKSDGEGEPGPGGEGESG